MSKIAFLPIIAALLAAAIISPSVVANTFAKSSDGDGDSGSSGDKPKSGHKSEPKVHASPIVAGVPAPQAAKDKDKDKVVHGPIVAGLPVATAGNGENGGSGSDSSYNNDNIKKFDTSKSPLDIAGSSDRIVEFKPGFNDTFFNSTLPYCFAVQSGSCYNSATGQIVP